jgi:hypothetical protein
MQTADATWPLFAMFGGLRIVSYIPQILRIARDRNGASAISYSTWLMWTGVNASTAIYASVNLGDSRLAFVSCIYAACCLAVILVTAQKRHRRSASSILRDSQPISAPRRFLALTESR